MSDLVGCEGKRVGLNGGVSEEYWQTPEGL